MTFRLNATLAADTHPVIDLPLSTALLMNDSRFPWLILVPRIENARDLIDLSRKERDALWPEIDAATRALKHHAEEHASVDKMNVASLGNMVPQLHIHIIARRTSDAAWPRPVWNEGTAVPYEPTTRDQIVAAVKARLTLPAEPEIGI
ncbi:MAG: HIT domain-containing protein [Pseudomonadota bacterium]